MQKYSIKLYPALTSNYAFFIIENATGYTYIVDVPDGELIDGILVKNNYILKGALITHHHRDHIQGIDFLKQKYDFDIIGNIADNVICDTITKSQKIGDEFGIFDGKLSVEIIDLDGHLDGQIGYYIKDINSIFVGDTIFNLGCGRFLDKNLDKMWHSICTIRNLPDNIMVYAAHEYGLDNAKFVESLGLKIDGLDNYIKYIYDCADNNIPSIPMNLWLQQKYNPFLNADNILVKQALNMINHSELQVLLKLRHLKNNYNVKHIITTDINNL